MFMGRQMLERLLDAYAGQARDVRAILETHLAAVITAKDAELKAVIAAKDAEVAFMREEAASARASLAAETARVNALMDRLLVRDARVAPVTPAPAAPSERLKKLQKVFDDMSATGQDFDTPDPLGDKTVFPMEDVKVEG